MEDVAKRLVDYGFHAPTMSFPVADTMMIEPTESEAKRELDRFCDAMIQIRQEIADGGFGRVGRRRTTSLRNAPHTHHLLLHGDLEEALQQGAGLLPAAGAAGQDKYWPPVGRIDNVYGDRHLVCSCPPMEDYLEAAE